MTYVTSGNLLIIDDDTELLMLMRDTLDFEGYNVTVTDDPTQIHKVADIATIDALLTDINMPQMNGLDVLKNIHNINPEIPVIIITGNADLNNLQAAFRGGAYDYLKKPFNTDELLITVRKAVEKRRFMKELNSYYCLLEEKVIQKTEQLTTANRKIEENLLATILAMINALEASDEYTRGHSERVTKLSLVLGKELGLSIEQLRVLRLGAVLHDIGKIGITHSILTKPSSLLPHEYQTMKEHPTIGHKILEPIDMENGVLDIIGQHHERIDGEGYPEGLKGDEISFLARIVAVADTYDAMTSDRPYRKKLARLVALEEIYNHRSVQFDVRVVDALHRLHDKIDLKNISNVFEITKRGENGKKSSRQRVK
ncbi:MAG: response regulator [Candidatus Cloacimonetes bacterium]|nr:response regulator [Candidatus Cloacimonadota bacterium]